ncbi:MAG: YqeG family HAD IIIA-type phosphatase [Lachnospiraceae bacterium]|nr:YqeG family HAD IIIA-type phosphatase [Lachnospiraceae bacterium]
MVKNLYPKNYLSSPYKIPYNDLWEQGFRGVIFDIDNTLVGHGAKANDEAIKLFEKLHGIGFRTLVLSNNNEQRVKPFAEAVLTKYIHRAKKPRRENYLKAMEMMGTEANTTFFVGDQLFTDIWGANNAGILSYLVDPVAKKEEIQIVLKRFLERPLLYFYKRNH